MIAVAGAQLQSYHLVEAPNGAAIADGLYLKLSSGKEAAVQAMVEAIMSEQQANIRWGLRSQCPPTLGLSVWPSGDILHPCWMLLV